MNAGERVFVVQHLFLSVGEGASSAPATFPEPSKMNPLDGAPLGRKFSSSLDFWTPLKLDLWPFSGFFFGFFGTGKLFIL